MFFSLTKKISLLALASTLLSGFIDSSIVVSDTRRLIAGWIEKETAYIQSYFFGKPLPASEFARQHLSLSEPAQP
jgi:hypothetical protein